MKIVKIEEGMDPWEFIARPTRCGIRSLIVPLLYLDCADEVAYLCRPR